MDVLGSFDAVIIDYRTHQLQLLSQAGSRLKVSPDMNDFKHF
jgi:hypothetical protein